MVDLPHKTTGDNYDLEVIGDQIRITERENGLDIENKAQKVKSGLDSYLTKAGNLVWFQLGEWSTSERSYVNTTQSIFRVRSFPSYTQKIT